MLHLSLLHVIHFNIYLTILVQLVTMFEVLWRHISVQDYNYYFEVLEVHPQSV